MVIFLQRVNMDNELPMAAVKMYAIATVGDDDEPERQDKESSTERVVV